jgi:DNA-binding CsgD family transcriptional regulator/PAS domain-containing protein
MGVARNGDPMPYQLTPNDLDRLTAALRVLVAPADYPTVSAWRDETHRVLRQLVEAASLTILLPIGDGSAWYHPDLEPGLADARVAELAANNPVTLRMVADGGVPDRWIVVDPATLFLAESKSESLLLLRVCLDGVEAGRLWFSFPTLPWTPGGRTHETTTARRVALLRAVMPALEAGLAAARAGAAVRNRPTGALDRLFESIGSALLFADPCRRTAQANPALERLLAEAADGVRLRRELEELARSLACNEAPALAPGESLPTRELRAGPNAYRIDATVLGTDPAGTGSGSGAILLKVEPLTSRPLSDDTLRSRYGLTNREIQVAQLLAGGCSNREIALALGIRPATARNHVERVLGKLRVRSRARVAATICGVAA